MASGPYTGPVTVLKVTHHGSSTSSTPLFLNRFPQR
jgi:beta-lactamase superfamily II metal-dependent hydrolase